MEGFEGPFTFVLDETIRRIDDRAASTLINDHSPTAHREEQNAVYRLRIGVKRTPRRTTKRHAWEKVRRLWIDVEPVGRGLRFISGHPPTMRQTRPLEPKRLSLSGSITAEAKVPLFSKLATTLKVQPHVPSVLNKDEVICVTQVTDRSAQWGFSPGWPTNTQFELMLHIAERTDLAAEDRFLKVKVFPEVKNRGDGIIKWLPFVPYDQDADGADSPLIVPLEALA